MEILIHSTDQYVLCIVEKSNPYIITRSQEKVENAGVLLIHVFLMKLQILLLYQFLQFHDNNIQKEINQKMMLIYSQEDEISMLCSFFFFF